MSGFRTAKALEEELGFEKYGLIERDIQVQEQFATQMKAQQMQQEMGQAAAPPENEEDIEPPTG